MPPKKPAPRSDELFRSQLDNMIDMGHALVKLARLIDWSRFDEAFGVAPVACARPDAPWQALQHDDPFRGGQALHDMPLAHGARTEPGGERTGHRPESARMLGHMLHQH